MHGLNRQHRSENMRSGSTKQQRSLRKATLEAQIEKLNAIGIALSSATDLNGLLELIVTEARHFTHADGGSLYILEGDRLNFTVAQTESLEQRDGKRRRFESFYLPLSPESIAGHVALTGEVLNVDDVYEIPPEMGFRVNKQFDINNNYRSKSMLVVPMRDHSQEIIGVLQLINSMNEDGEVVPFDTEYESLILSLASQAAVAIRNVKLIDEIRNLFKSLVRYSAKAIDARSPHTAGHSGRVAKYSVLLAQAVNDEQSGPLKDVYFSPQQIEELRVSAWLHDIGKIGVRESVLEKIHKLNKDQIKVIEERFALIKSTIKNRYLEEQLRLMVKHNGPVDSTELKTRMQAELAAVDCDLRFINKINSPGRLNSADQERLKGIRAKTYLSDGVERPFLTEFEMENLSVVKGNLTDPEYREMQSHVEQTIAILNKIEFTKDLENVPVYAAAHHEYLDGSGYPRGLKGNAIPIQSRIMCIADIFDAINAPDRPYRSGSSVEQTVNILKKEVAAGKLDPDLVDVFIRERIYDRAGINDDEE